MEKIVFLLKKRFLNTNNIGLQEKILRIVRGILKNFKKFFEYYFGTVQKKPPDNFKCISLNPVEYEFLFDFTSHSVTSLKIAIEK